MERHSHHHNCHCRHPMLCITTVTKTIMIILCDTLMQLKVVDARIYIAIKITTPKCSPSSHTVCASCDCRTNAENNIWAHSFPCYVVCTSILMPPPATLHTHSPFFKAVSQSMSSLSSSTWKTVRLFKIITYITSQCYS